MIGWNYKSDIELFRWVEEQDKEGRNGKKRVQKVKSGGPMTQDMYSKDILPNVHARKREVEAKRLNHSYFKILD